MKFAELLADWIRRYGKLTILGIILIVGVLTFWFGLKTTLKTDFPLLPVDSTSMSPILDYGDLIIVQGITNACDIEPGAIIIFHEPGMYGNDLIILRATKETVINGSCYLKTKGDANPSEAPWEVTDAHIVGKCIGRISWLGHVPLFVGRSVFPFLSTPTGFLALILLILGIMLLKHISQKKN